MSKAKGELISVVRIGLQYCKGGMRVKFLIGLSKVMDDIASLKWIKIWNQSINGKKKKL